MDVVYLNESFVSDGRDAIQDGRECYMFQYYFAYI